MQFLLYLSNFMIPIVIFYIVGYGLCSHTDIFGAFVKGAQDGFKVVLKVLPTLIGLMMAIGILRASGLMEMLSTRIAPIAEKADFPAVLVPLISSARPAAAAFRMSSPATVLMVSVGALASMLYAWVAEALLPLALLTLACTFAAPSGRVARSAAGTVTLQLPLAATLAV